MKRWLCGLICITLLGCASKPQASPPVAGSSKPTEKIYFHGKGPDHDLLRFQKFLDIALVDYGMARTDSEREADATVNVEVSRREETTDLYTPLLWVGFTSRDGADYIAKSCSSVSTSDSIFGEPINVISSIKFPEDWKKHEKLAVYIDESQVNGLKQLIPALKEGLDSGGHHITDSRMNADVALKSIKLQKLAVPIRINVLDIDLEVFDRQGTRFYYTSGKGSTELAYVGPGPGIKLENIPCGSTMKTFWNYSDGSWHEARDIARTIREHLEQASHSN